MHIGNRPAATAAGATTVAVPPLAPIGWRIAVWAALPSAGVLAWVATDPAATAAAAAADPELTRLLRSMAVIKASVALGLAWLVQRRLRGAARPVYAGAALVAIGLLAAGSVAIWQVGAVARGALLFHAGLVLLAGTAWCDRRAIGALLATAAGH